ncbi:helix-turn-helix domain-containing protein [Streptomyces sp. NPDC086766]|uniref:helix-turn-helix domain-containing protein n=1 Tax=Streptomyces sp. NPDC086766 TaxID=3365754 RepID=UPI0037FEDDEA
MADVEPAQALARLRQTLRAHVGTARLNTSQLATRAELGRTTVSKALNDGHERPTWPTVAAIAKALRLSADEQQALLGLWEQAGAKKTPIRLPSGAREPLPQEVLRRRSGAQIAGAAAGALVVAVSVAVGVVWWLSNSSDAEASGPLLVTYKWPTMKSCDGATSVAMPRGGKPLTAFHVDNQDFRSVVTSPRNKGGTWGAGHLYVDLGTKDDTTVTIDELHLSARVPQRIGPPTWVALTQGGCGDVQDRVFDLNLDRPQLVDRGVQGELQPGDKPAPTNHLGSGFTVNAKDPAIIRVDVTACHGNYEWSLVIEYTYNGHQFHKQLGPFRSLSVADKNTRAYAPNPGTGAIGEALTDIGAPLGCPATS